MKRIIGKMSIRPVGKRFCKFCWDRGRPTSECFSHYVKDKKGPDGQIVCPVLLEEECMRCGMVGHTPRYCNSANPVLTRDNPTGDRTKCTCCLRMIHCENWIEPIPDHMRTKYLEWKVSEKKHALRQRGMAESRSRHILCEEYDDDTKEMLIGLASRSSTFYGRETPDREAPYSDYELEVLAKLDVNREMMREHFPAGMMRYAPSERQAFRAIVYASRTIFYGINYDDDDDVFNPNPKNTKNTTFYIDRIGSPHANFDGDNPWSYFSGRDDCDETGTYNPYGISETDPIVVEYQTRILTKMNEMKHDRSPESRRRMWVNSKSKL